RQNQRRELPPQGKTESGPSDPQRALHRSGDKLYFEVRGNVSTLWSLGSGLTTFLSLWRSLDALSIPGAPSKLPPVRTLDGFKVSEHWVLVTASTARRAPTQGCVQLRRCLNDLR